MRENVSQKKKNNNNQSASPAAITFVKICLCERAEPPYTPLRLRVQMMGECTPGGDGGTIPCYLSRWKACGTLRRDSGDLSDSSTGLRAARSDRNHPTAY